MRPFRFVADNSDLIACVVLWKDGTKTRRFLVIDVLQLILVEPDTKRLGWGVAKLVGFLQDIEVTGDKDDSRCLHITIHRPLSGTTTNRVPLLSAKFVFDDNIRCMAAKQRLTKVSGFFVSSGLGKWGKNFTKMKNLEYIL
jgi:protein CLEC16A